MRWRPRPRTLLKLDGRCRYYSSPSPREPLVPRRRDSRLCMLAAHIRPPPRRDGERQSRPHREASESPDPEVKCSLLQVLLFSPSSSVLLFVMDPQMLHISYAIDTNWEGYWLYIGKLQGCQTALQACQKSRRDTFVRYSTAHSPIPYRSPYQSTPTINSEGPPLSLPLLLFLSLHLPAAHCSLSFRSFARSPVGVVIIIISSWPLLLRPSFLSLFMIYILRTFVRSSQSQLSSIDRSILPSDVNEATALSKSHLPIRLSY